MIPVELWKQSRHGVEARTIDAQVLVQAVADANLFDHGSTLEVEIVTAEKTLRV